ncbi:MAG: carboxypeptidase-like regulatory domain-containing protein, partial [Gemmatimonadota bacterium]
AGADGELPFRGVGLQSALVGRRGSLSARIDRVDGAVPGRPGVAGATEAALDGAARLGTAGELRASLRAARHGGGAGWSDLHFDAGAERRLAGGHRIAAGVRLARAGAGAALRNLFRIDYTVPVGVPVARGGEGGRVVGRVYDAETGAPLAGALVTLGGRMVLTDAAGRLAFAGLPAGSYRLRVEGRGPGAGRVPLDDAPVVLRPGEREVRVEVGMTRRARLRGVVRLVSGADSSGMPGVVLELSCGGETLRRVSGADGGFDFTDLRPGRWTLSVAAAGLPPHHRFEREVVELELARGEARELALRVLPARRPVRMITGGEVVVEAPRPGGGRP